MYGIRGSVGRDLRAAERDFGSAHQDKDIDGMMNALFDMISTAPRTRLPRLAEVKIYQSFDAYQQVLLVPQAKLDPQVALAAFVNRAFSQEHQLRTIPAFAKIVKRSLPKLLGNVDKLDFLADAEETASLLRKIIPLVQVFPSPASESRVLDQIDKKLVVTGDANIQNGLARYVEKYPGLKNRARGFSAEQCYIYNTLDAFSPVWYCGRVQRIGTELLDKKFTELAKAFHARYPKETAAALIDMKKSGIYYMSEIEQREITKLLNAGTRPKARRPFFGHNL